MFISMSQDKISINIVNQIRDHILSGKLKPGDRLPTEKNLINQFNVSKHTLREALRALEAMGFLEIRKGAGGGPVVMEIDMETTRNSIANFLHFKNVSVRDLSETRKAFEPYLAGCAARAMTDEDIEKLDRLNKACRELLDRGEHLYGAREEIEFHVQLAESNGNPVLLMILDFVNSLLTDAKHHIKPGIDFCEKVLAAHINILDAIKNRDSGAAAAAMTRHICEVEEGLEEASHKYRDKTS